MKATNEQISVLRHRLKEEIKSVQEELAEFGANLILNIVKHHDFSESKENSFFIELADDAIIHQLKKSLESRQFFKREVKTLFDDDNETDF